ncbi:MAG: DNA repair protein RecO [Candidatus Kerfeldbacteria bacterium]|nr:DNA repair protein RecO [Candidatus Kerfeldbacteria bacterium]
MGMYQLTGIILRHQDVREVDRLVTIYSQEQGMATLRARGVRKISSKLAGSLEPLQAAVLTAVTGATFDTITGAEIQSTFPSIHLDPRRKAVAWFCAALVATVSHERQRDTRVYQLLEQTFVALETHDGPALYQLLRWHFSWRLLVLLGHAPELRNCMVCHQAMSADDTMFSVKRGGLVHLRCRGVDASARPITTTTIKLIRELCNEDMKRVRRLRYPASIARESDTLIDTFLSYIFERDISFGAFGTLV